MRSNPICSSIRRDSGTEDHPHQKCQKQDYQYKDRLSVYRIGDFYYTAKT